RWLRVNQLFHSALEREPAQRAAFLDQACADDQELRREVESLIGSSENSDSFIDAPGFGTKVQLLDDERLQRMILGVSHATVERDLTVAKAWLRREMSR